MSKIVISNEAEMLKLGMKVAKTCSAQCFLLTGDLGAGKTTFVKGFLSFYQFQNVKSPTYNIINKYKSDEVTIHHCDTYRLNNEDIGFDEIFDNSIVLIEWWQNIKSYLPQNCVEVSIEVKPSGIRHVEIKEQDEALS